MIKSEGAVTEQDRLSYETLKEWKQDHLLDQTLFGQNSQLYLGDYKDMRINLLISEVERLRERIKELENLKIECGRLWVTDERKN